MIFKHRLFWKIFLFFCVTVAVMLSVGEALSAWATREIGKPPQVHDFLSVYGKSAVAQYELEGQPALKRQFDEWSNNFFSHYYLVDAKGRELSGSAIPEGAEDSFPSVVLSRGRKLKDGVTYEHAAGNWVMQDISVSGTRGQYYFGVAFRPLSLLEKVFQVYFGALIIYGTFAIAGCALLSLYFTRPIGYLREVSGRLAVGNLDARVDEKTARRTDEIGGLVRDFNAMADRLRDLLQSHKQLLGDVSHELRSPLARQRVAIALAQKLQTEEQKPLLERIRGESVRLDELIGRILLLSNLDSGAEQPESTCYSLNEAVDQVVEDAIFEAKRSGQVLTYSAAGGEIAVLGNKELFSSAVENVVRNALKYAKTGPIEVRLKAEHGIATLQVRDYGPGIPNPELEKVFRPFYRLNASAPNHEEGAGLGLAIAYRAIALHKGSIRLWNAAPRGLIVEFQVPTTSFSLYAA